MNDAFFTLRLTSNSKRLHITTVMRLHKAFLFYLGSLKCVPSVIPDIFCLRDNPASCICLCDTPQNVIQTNRK